MRTCYWFLAVAICLLAAGFAHALSITDNDTGALVTANWVILNDAAVTGNASDYQVKTATDNWGAFDSDPQVNEWHAAGAQLPANVSGYTVNFTYDLYTWDSYTDMLGGGNGYYDNQGVNLNSVDFLWNQALTDPATTWPGSTFSWGGVAPAVIDHAAGSTAVTGGGSDVFLTVFTSTGLDPDQDTSFPSWGAFNTEAESPNGGGAAVPEPATIALLLAGLAGLAGVRRRRT